MRSLVLRGDAGEPDRSVRAEMAVALAALFGSGGTLTLLSLLFRDWVGLNRFGVAAPALAAEVIAVVLLLAGPRLPYSAFHAFLASGTACIGVAVYFGGGAAPGIYSPYFVWVALYAFFFFTARAAWTHLALTSATYLTVLLLTDSIATGPAWLVTTGTSSVAGLVIAYLVRKVRSLASTDALTGLANRRAWDDALAREVALAGRTGRPFCVALLDLDDLKALNDELGHGAGDAAISRAAVRWHSLTRRGDLLARLGGDEFGLLLHDCDIGGAGKFLERIHGADIGLSVSSGLARHGVTESAEGIMARADVALYEAKRLGRNRTVTATDRPAVDAEQGP